MRARSQVTCPRHDKYPGGGSETFSVQAALLHIWRCRHEYNPPLSPRQLPQSYLLNSSFPSSPLLLALTSSPRDKLSSSSCFARRERGSEAALQNHLFFSPSLVSPIFEWVLLVFWVAVHLGTVKTSSPLLCSQFSRMIAG